MNLISIALVFTLALGNIFLFAVGVIGFGVSNSLRHILISSCMVTTGAIQLILIVKAAIEVWC